MALLIKLIVINLLVYFLCILPFSIGWGEIPTPTASLTEIAHWDLSVVGHYDDKMINSLKFVFSNYMQKLNYFCDVPFNRSSLALREWCKEHTYDKDRRIEYAINEVTSELVSKIPDNGDEYPWSFTGRDAYLPELSSVLRCNDYVDMETLYDGYYEVMRGKLK